MICLALAAATTAAYWRVGTLQFLDYDDFQIFFANDIVRHGLAWNNLVWAATTNYYEYWHPLMWLSHLLDCQLFGLNPAPHHWVSLGLHVANTLLVFAFLRSLTGKVWRSAMVAGLFGLHPTHVESVAWLAERKDVLSTFFWLLSVCAYVHYGRAGRKKFFWLSLVFFLFGLMTKPMVVTLPFVLLLLDYWPLNRWKPASGPDAADGAVAVRRTAVALALEKWPFFILTTIFCFTTWYSVSLGNNIQSTEQVPWGLRLSNIPVAYVRYLWKTIWPAHLAVLYPMPSAWPVWQVALSVVALAAITYAVLRFGKSAGYLVFGWLMFMGLQVPVIGIMSVGAQSIADRYLYLSSLGLFVAGVWGTAELSARWFRAGLLPTAVAGAALAICGVLTCQQTAFWRDTVALWEHCIATGYDGRVARFGLGSALLEREELDGAVKQFAAAETAARQDDPEIEQRLGTALTAAGRLSEATNCFLKALAADPNYAEAHENYGFALIELRDFKGATAEFQQAIRLQPNKLDAYVGMGAVADGLGQSAEAVDIYNAALRKQPAFARAHFLLGMHYLKQKALKDAATNFEMQVSYDPARVAPRIHLAQIAEANGEAAAAVAQYRAALALNPDLLVALNNLAWLLASSADGKLRNGPEAVRLAERACEQTSYQQAFIVGTLAAAYAEAGQFDKAVSTAQKACDAASAQGLADVVQKNQELLALYKSGKAYHQGN